MTPYYTDEATTIYHGDCRDVLPTLGACDHVIVDPPYSAYTQAHSRRGTAKAGGEARDLGFVPIDDALRHALSIYAGLSTRRWVLVFSDVESTPLWRTALVEGAGLDYIRTGAWVKLGATPQFTGDRPAVGFEAITICHRPGRKCWNGGGTAAVWSIPVLNRGREARTHTTQKPEGLMTALVYQFTDPGELILDPCMGSGTTLVAAKRLGRTAIGIDCDEASCEQAARRLAQAALPFEPPTPRREKRERAGLLDLAEVE